MLEKGGAKVLPVIPQLIIPVKSKLRLSTCYRIFSWIIELVWFYFTQLPWTRVTLRSWQSPLRFCKLLSLALTPLEKPWCRTTVRSCPFWTWWRQRMLIWETRLNTIRGSATILATSSRQPSRYSNSMAARTRSLTLSTWFLPMRAACWTEQS